LHRAWIVAFLPIPEIDFNRIDPESFLSERNELAMYQCFSWKPSSYEVAPTDGIAAVQHYVSWSGDEQSKIGHRSNDAHDPVQTTRASAHCYAAISCDVPARGRQAQDAAAGVHYPSQPCGYHPAGSHARAAADDAGDWLSNLGPTSPESYPHILAAFHQGLKETGYTEGQNVAIEYRWARVNTIEFPALATELVSRKPSVIVTVGGSASALAAKAATTTIPIVFMTGIDPVQIGLVQSLSRPGSNIPGVTLFTAELAAKRLQMLRELAPTAGVIALLVTRGTRTIAQAKFRKLTMPEP
jgi:hypothetical protein